MEKMTERDKKRFARLMTIFKKLLSNGSCSVSDIAYELQKNHSVSRKTALNFASSTLQDMEELKIVRSERKGKETIYDLTPYGFMILIPIATDLELSKIKNGAEKISLKEVYNGLIKRAPTLAPYIEAMNLLIDQFGLLEKMKSSEEDAEEKEKDAIEVFAESFGDYVLMTDWKKSGDVKWEEIVDVVLFPLQLYIFEGEDVFEKRFEEILEWVKSLSFYEKGVVIKALSYLLEEQERDKIEEIKELERSLEKIKRLKQKIMELVKQ